jgi:hypothetical protein
MPKCSKRRPPSEPDPEMMDYFWKVAIPSLWLFGQDWQPSPSPPEPQPEPNMNQQKNKQTTTKHQKHIEKKTQIKTQQNSTCPHLMIYDIYKATHLQYIAKYLQV